LSRLLILAPDDRYFWTHRRHLARAAMEQGHDVLVVVPEGPYVRRLEEEGFSVRTVAKQRVRSLGGAWKAFRDVLALYRRERPDLVHHVSMRAILAGGLAARLTGIRSRVALVSGLGSLFVSGRRWQRACVVLAYRLVLGSSRTLVVFQNEDDREWFLRHHLVEKATTRLIPGSGVETKRFQARTSPARTTTGAPVILFAGRLIADKGLRILIEAARLLQEREIPHRLRLVGAPDDGNPSSLTPSELRAHEAAGLLEWRPWTDRVEGAYAAADLACLPSFREGLPLFLLEAAAAGLPVVAADTPGTRDAVLPGKTGLLAPPGRPAALADALELLLTQPQLRFEMGRAGRRFVAERFSAERVDAETLAVYREALHPSAGAGPPHRSSSSPPT